jgi:hypothetical protein
MKKRNGDCRCGAQTSGSLRDGLRQQGMRFARTFCKQGTALSRIGDTGKPVAALGEDAHNSERAANPWPPILFRQREEKANASVDFFNIFAFFEGRV